MPRRPPPFNPGRSQETRRRLQQSPADRARGLDHMEAKLAQGRLDTRFDIPHTNLPDHCTVESSTARQPSSAFSPTASNWAPSDADTPALRQTRTPASLLGSSFPLGAVKRSRTSKGTSRPTTPQSGTSHAWKAASVRHIAQQVVQPLLKQSASLVHGYMVCGLHRDPTEWVVAPKPPNGRPQRTAGAVGSFLSPQILGSIPQHERDEESIQTFTAALKAVFPNDCELCVGVRPPGSTCHSFVLQLNSGRSLYGVALRLWVRSDRERLTKIAAMLETSELDSLPANSSVWIPYSLSYLSHYPLFDLLTDYLRCSWMLWSKVPDKFNSDGVLRIMKMPPPKPDQFLRVTLEEYTLCYQVPSLSCDFQNFPLWPLFTCLSTRNLLGVIEAALSPEGRIILTSHHLSILTIAAETIRFYLRTWTGLYSPVAYGRHAQELVDEPGPYILGFSKQSRPLYNAPKDALVVDLDYDRIFTSAPPSSLSQRQRAKYASILAQATHGASIEGVPSHLCSAYQMNVRFSAFGGLMAQDTTQWIKEPSWWNGALAQQAMQDVSDRVRRSHRLLRAFRTLLPNNAINASGVQALHKLSPSTLSSMTQDRNALARALSEAWREYITLKARSDARSQALKTTEEQLTSDLDKQKRDFEELSECTEQLIEETRSLQGVINMKNKELAKIQRQLTDKTTHARQMSNHVRELQRELDSAGSTLKAQEDLLHEMERKRGAEESNVSQERDDAQRAVIHLTSLISGQVAYIERVMASLIVPGSRPGSTQDFRKDAAARGRRQSSLGGPNAAVASMSRNNLVERRSPSPPAGSSSNVGLGFGFAAPPSTTPPLGPQAPAPAPGPSSVAVVPFRKLPASGNRRSFVAVNDSNTSPPGGRSQTPDNGRPSQSTPVAAVMETDSFDEKVRIITETVRKINLQCFAAIQDLASKREAGSGGSSPVVGGSNSSVAANGNAGDVSDKATGEQSPALPNDTNQDRVRSPSSTSNSTRRSSSRRSVGQDTTTEASEGEEEMEERTERQRRRETSSTVAEHRSTMSDFSQVPDLDSRAETRQSGWSAASSLDTLDQQPAHYHFYHRQSEERARDAMGYAVRIHPIEEEADEEIEGIVGMDEKRRQDIARTMAMINSEAARGRSRGRDR
ncbi:hypothetical protein DV735_g4983, partial [Chaetothyriales sp. CBS 134920]